MKNLKNIEHYLYRMGHTPQTVKSYLYSIEQYLETEPQAQSYTYQQVLDYMAGITARYDNRQSPVRILASIKKYYDYLLEEGSRQDHPCRKLIIKSPRNRAVIHNDLFTAEELELLLNHKERYPALETRNRLMASLLIFQGLSTGEISRLETRHVDLDAGTIYIKESAPTTRRHLDILPRQYRLFDRYLHNDRPQQLREGTKVLLLGKLGTAIKTEDINYYVSTFKALFPGRNLNPRTIRQSVIANWLNHYKLPLEQVQLMAGHRWISATQRYLKPDINQQHEMIRKFHPLGTGIVM